MHIMERPVSPPFSPIGDNEDFEDSDPDIGQNSSSLLPQNTEKFHPTTTSHHNRGSLSTADSLLSAAEMDNFEHDMEQMADLSVKEDNNNAMEHGRNECFFERPQFPNAEQTAAPNAEREPDGAYAHPPSHQMTNYAAFSHQNVPEESNPPAHDGQFQHAASVSLTPTPVANESSNAHDQNDAKRAALTTMDPTTRQEEQGIIELLENGHEGNYKLEQSLPMQSAANDHMETYNRKRPKLSNEMKPSSGAEASYHARAQTAPGWLKPSPNNGTAISGHYSTGSHIINPGQSLPGYVQNGAPYDPGQMYNNTSNRSNTSYGAAATNYSPSPSSFQMQNNYPSVALDKPVYVNLPSDFVPTFKNLIPFDFIKPKRREKTEKKAYQLSLIGLREFTITGLPLYPDGDPCSVQGLRKTIKQISKEHGKAVYERDTSGIGGRWKIPIGAYHAFVAFLQADPSCVRLEAIPQMHLKIASLGAAREEKGLPSPEELHKKGVPLSLAETLAPFQRGGVDFVLEREGRALIADEMGLGKTIQAVASMSVYHKEWPVLILTPSGARYHWESEFRNWLGVNGAAVKQSDNMQSADGDYRDDGDFDLLTDDQINVLTSSKVEVLPDRNTRVVICSYGLAPMLAQSSKITPGMFRCAIADESHMLKNIKSKRTSTLLPILNACNRVILLSGTPALAKPLELWPQLQILRISGQPGFWDDEQQFQDKYVKRNNARNRAELATMLKGTVMIRRMKDSILKDMPKKVRQKVIVSMEGEDVKKEMQECMMLLREGKGVLGKLARQHSSIVSTDNKQANEYMIEKANAKPGVEANRQRFNEVLRGQQTPAANEAEIHLENTITQKYQQRQREIQHTLLTSNNLLDPNEVNNFVSRMDRDIRAELEVSYLEQMQLLQGQGVDHVNLDKQPSRATVLSKMYSLTARCKIPAIVDFLKKWLNDPTNGKICVFAHHIFVLDEIEKNINLSNSGDAGTYKFIRIDGSTSPRSRQEQIDAFQNDPSIRVAMLGITAAGVAVTLTASSQVLFAELFWTPAIMVQAEDRCHRIGQQARVRCMYFVAKGTLDDILWKLIEKKFRELGEFVEGKEKLKMVVEKIYKDKEELDAIFSQLEGEESDNENANDSFSQPDRNESNYGEGPDIVPLDTELEHDIEELGKEEQHMLSLADRDDEDGDTEPMQGNATVNIVGEQEIDVRGKSEEDAIALSDDEEEEETNPGVSVAKAIEPGNFEAGFNTDGVLPHCQIYKLWLQGPFLGIQIDLFKGKIVVSKKLSVRIQQLGEDCKPDVGDILVAVGNTPVDGVKSLGQAITFLNHVLRHGTPREMWFADDPDFKAFYTHFTARNESRISERRREGGGEEGRPAKDTDEVVVIDD